MTDAPKLKMLAHNGGLPSGNYPANQLVPYVRLDAPELVVLVDALREVMDGENWKQGRKFCGNSGNFSLQSQRAALAAWDKLALAGQPNAPTTTGR